MTGYPGGYPPPQQPPDYPPGYAPQYPPGYPPQGYGPPGYPGMPYAPGPVGPRNGLGITALVLAVVALLAFWSVIGGIVLGVAAVIVGVAARRRVRRGEATNGGVAMAGVVLGVVAVVLSAAFIAVWVSMFDELGGSDYLDCVARAGSDRQAVDGCVRQLTDRLDQQFSTVPSAR